MPSRINCPRCQARLVLPDTKPEGPILCPRCRSEVPLPHVHVTAQPAPPAETSIPPEPGPQADVARCPWCGAALPEQCRVCPNCEQVLGASPKETWLDQVREGLVGENPHAEGLLRAAAVLGALYLSGLVALGVGILLSQAVPMLGPMLGFVLFVCLLIGLLVLVLKALVPEQTRRSILPPKARRGILLALVLAGVVCSLLLVSVVALCGFFFTACSCTGGRIFQ